MIATMAPRAGHDEEAPGDGELDFEVLRLA